MPAVFRASLLNLSHVGLSGCCMITMNPVVQTVVVHESWFVVAVGAKVGWDWLCQARGGAHWLGK